MNRLIAIILGAFLLANFLPRELSAQAEIALTNKYYRANIYQDDVPYTARAKQQFQFLAFFINQGVASNMYPQASLFNGQLVGRLYGQNSSTTSDEKVSAYLEQRIIPFFIYQPKLFNGKAILRASFEIDWTWGDQAYGIGGNKGSAISGDQVNIQTQNLELELIPATGWSINLGLQRLYDTPYNPYRTFFDKMTYTGYRLAYWGTDGVGVSVRYENDYHRAKAGYYKLYENLPEINDDVTLMEAIYEKKINKVWNLGASVYMLRDRGKGQGGVSVFGQGLNSTLANYMGAFNFGLSNQTIADIVWTGVFFSRNNEFWQDRWQVSGFANYNTGPVRNGDNGSWVKVATIGGMSANLRAAYRHGQTPSDFISIDLMHTTGDDNLLSDGKYSGVITGNTYGMPANVFISSGTYLLFPHGNVVNRYTPLVADISNMGYGLNAVVMNAQKDVIPYKLNVKIGGAVGMSVVTPFEGGNMMGQEINGALKYHFGPFMSLELHAAYLNLGNFYDSNDDSHGYEINGENYDSRPVNPWTAFVVFKWLMF